VTHCALLNSKQVAHLALGLVKVQMQEIVQPEKPEMLVRVLVLTFCQHRSPKAAQGARIRPSEKQFRMMTEALAMPPTMLKEWPPQTLPVAARWPKASRPPSVFCNFACFCAKVFPY